MKKLFLLFFVVVTFTVGVSTSAHAQLPIYIADAFKKAAPAGGFGTGSGGGFSRKFELDKPASSDAYLFNIKPDKYKDKHAITLSITSASGAKADIKLINKKVPAEIVK
jgi:hypothetical protein